MVCPVLVGLTGVQSANTTAGKAVELHSIFTYKTDVQSAVKPVLSGHSKIDKTKIYMTNDSLMKVAPIAECSNWSILQYV